MSLRDALRTAVARCASLETQHATFPERDATADATGVQQMPANPHEIWVSRATGTATGVQQGQLHSANFEGVGEGPMQPGPLTAHRLSADLIEAAMVVCDRHGDDDVARQEMRDQCLELPPHLQADLLEHFRGVRRGTD